MTYASEVLADSPAVYHRMGEASGTAMLDSSGNGLDGTYSGSVALGMPGVITDSDTSSFYNANGWGDSPYVPPTTFSLEFWMQASVKGWYIAGCGFPGFGQQDWMIATNGSGYFYFQYGYPGSGGPNIVVSGLDVCNNAPHHIVVTIAGTAYKIHIDGTERVNGTLPSALWGSGGTLRLGHSQYNGYYKGYLDEVAVYETPLSDARIAAHYSAGLAVSSDKTIASVDFSGSGTFGAAAPYLTIASVGFSGSGILTASTPTHLAIGVVAFDGSGTLSTATSVPALTIPVAAFSGSGAFAVGDTDLYIPPELTLEILDNVVSQAPTPLTVVLVEGFPEMDVEFRIDGVLIYTGRTDSDGYLAPTSINVPEELGAAGEHTLTATQPGAGIGIATFTVQRDPSLNPTTMGPDAQAVDVPGAVRANGTRRWVFQDLLPGGLGSWIMPKNPAEGPLPYNERQFTTQVTTTGQPHVSEGMSVPVDWQFSGIALDEEFAEKLLAYRNLNRRFYIINNRGQAFKVIVTNVELVPRLQKNFGDDEDYLEAQWIDGHDYTVTATVLDQDWVVPA